MDVPTEVQSPAERIAQSRYADLWDEFSVEYKRYVIATTQAWLDTIRAAGFEVVELLGLDAVHERADIAVRRGVFGPVEAVVYTDGLPDTTSGWELSYQHCGFATDDLVDRVTSSLLAARAWAKAERQAVTVPDSRL